LNNPRHRTRRPSSGYVPSFRGTTDLKFSEVEQEAIRYAETALGYRPQPRARAPHPPVGLGQLVLVLLGMLFLSSLLLTITREMNSHFSPRSESPTASGGPPASDRRMPAGNAPARSPRPMSQGSEPLHVATGVPAPPPAVYPNVGDHIIAVTPRQFESLAGVQPQDSTKTVSESQSPNQPPIQEPSAMQPEGPACPRGPSPAQPITATQHWRGFGLPDPGPLGSGWHSFAPPQPAASNPSGLRFGPPRPESRSGESDQALQPAQSLRRSKQHPVKRHSLFRRVLGGVGRVFEGVAEGVAAPLQGLTQGLQVQTLVFPYSQPTTLHWWTGRDGFRVQPQAFPNFAPPWAERRIDP
jgi:hypothetical protein